MLAILETGGGDLPELDWDSSAHFAHLIDGYGLCEQAGLGEFATYADTKLRQAEESGEWSGSTLELWVSLFLEHRRWRMAGWEPAAEQVALLDSLCRALTCSLSAEAAAPL